jgi:hypothetical protein
MYKTNSLLESSNANGNAKVKAFILTQEIRADSLNNFSGIICVHKTFHTERNLYKGIISDQVTLVPIQKMCWQLIIYLF